ncbi:Response regulator PleD [Enhygromyxa salina]|uniref:diguanylate cyclase n=1 Tax=Enhygromyxa salina TaxID=215803 RepID=A0A2S9Y7I5_9BACT|nr:GGDEF domain-containing protein [Enhygromyxa salina]PRQ01032.1 Response regulator PleD [Enhygromyxa salina]
METPSHHAQLHALTVAVRALDRLYRQEIAKPIKDALQVTPQEVGRFYVKLETLRSWLNNSRTVDDMRRDPLAPMIKMALLLWRRERAAEIEVPRSRTTDSKVVMVLDEEIQAIDWLLNELRLIEPERMPVLTDYMSVHQAELVGQLPQDDPPLEYDVKFRILLSANRVTPDFQFYRKRCDIREVPITLAFVDIDKFKDINTEFGHTTVDFDLLPQFQQGLEAHVFFRGRAYREGGDEYILLLPNMSYEGARQFLCELQRRMTKIRYRLSALRSNPTVSIGFVTLNPGSIITAREAREKATHALLEAKDAGRNRIVGLETHPHWTPKSVEISR